VASVPISDGVQADARVTMEAIMRASRNLAQGLRDMGERLRQAFEPGSRSQVKSQVGLTFAGALRDARREYRAGLAELESLPSESRLFVWARLTPGLAWWQVMDRTVDVLDDQERCRWSDEQVERLVEALWDGWLGRPENQPVTPLGDLW